MYLKNKAGSDIIRPLKLEDFLEKYGSNARLEFLSFIKRLLITLKRYNDKETISMMKELLIDYFHSEKFVHNQDDSEIEFKFALADSYLSFGEYREAFDICVKEYENADNKTKALISNVVQYISAVDLNTNNINYYQLEALRLGIFKFEIIQ